MEVASSTIETLKMAIMKTATGREAISIASGGVLLYTQEFKYSNHQALRNDAVPRIEASV